MEAEAQQILDDNGFSDWDVESDVTLICPHGECIEWDGECPNGCVSPLMALGLV